MLPVIDISPLFGSDAAARLAVARQIGAACETTGFLYVSGHGIGEEVIAGVRAAQEAFFAEPVAEKQRYTRREGVYRGYIPIMPFGNNPDGVPPPLYEAFILGDDAPPEDPEVAATGGLYGPNVWPESPAGFRAAVEPYLRAVDGVAMRLLGAFALALGQEEEALTGLFTRPLSNISLLHYLSRPDAVGAPPDALNAHRDTNAITVLLPSPVGGLEVQRPDGAYVPVPPQPGCFVVNIGNMMECWSGGRFRSTMHRVHPPRERERYSIGYFAVPDFATVVEPLPGVPVTGKADDMAPRHAGHDLAGFVGGFDRYMREQATA